MIILISQIHIEVHVRFWINYLIIVPWRQPTTNEIQMTKDQLKISIIYGNVKSNWILSLLIPVMVDNSQLIIRSLSIQIKSVEWNILIINFEN